MLHIYDDLPCMSNVIVLINERKKIIEWSLEPFKKEESFFKGLCDLKRSHKMRYIYDDLRGIVECHTTN